MRQKTKASPPNTNITPVILAGGKGLRLRPLTSPSRPKALVKFFSKHSFLQQTLLRIPNLGSPIIITEEKHVPKILEQLKKINITSARIIAEPTGRSTAAAITLAAHMAKDENLLILPCDQAIKNDQEFEHNVTTAAIIPLDDKFLLFGIKPTKPETRYGYIESRTGNLTIDTVNSFKEKPNKQTAQTYIKTDKHLWNTGIFLTHASHLLSEMKKHQPSMMQIIDKAIHKIEGNILYLHKDIFETLEPLSIDHALMEKTDTAYVTNLNIHWSDTGTWSSLIASKFGMF